jgi:hypothetical protein
LRSACPGDALDRNKIAIPRDTNDYATMLAELRNTRIDTESSGHLEGERLERRSRCYYRIAQRTTIIDEGTTAKSVPIVRSVPIVSHLPNGH